MTQWVKDLALPQFWCRLQLHREFDPWPRNFQMLLLRLKKKKKKRKEKTEKQKPLSLLWKGL